LLDRPSTAICKQGVSLRVTLVKSSLRRVTSGL